MSKLNKIWRYLVPSLFLIGVAVFDYIQPVSAAYLTGGTGYWNNNGTSIYYNNGNIGIGTDTPAAMLQINPTGSNEGIRIISSNFSPFVIRNTANTSDLLRVDQYGSATLTNTTTINKAVVAGGSSTNWAGLNIGGTQSVNASGTIYSYSAVCVNNNSGACNSTGGVVIGLANTSANINIPNSGNAFFNNGSNVGIGVTNPADNLSVQKTNAGGMGGNIAILNFGTSGATGSAASIDFGLESSTYTDTASNAQIKAYLEGANNSAALIFSTYNGSSFGERVRIRGNGNVGIGTTDPGSYKLNVNGNANFVGQVAVPTPTVTSSAVTKGYVDDAFTAYNTNNNYWKISGSNLYASSTAWNIGVGTTNPLDKLHISGANTSTVTWPLIVNNQYNANVTNYGVGIKLKQSNDSELTKWVGLAAIAQTGYSNATDMGFFTSNGTERMRLTHGGSLGIGTTNPSSKLEIKGGHADTSFRMNAQTGQASPDDSAYLSLWASEPNYTYTGVGIGNNINNNPNSGRINTARGASYIRLLDNGIGFYTITSAGVTSTNMYMSGGNVGIGTISPTSSGGYNRFLHIQGGYASLILDSTTSAKKYEIGSSAAGGLDFYDGTAGAVRMTINTTGGGNFVGQLAVPTPTATSSAVNKGYVDSAFTAYNDSSNYWKLSGSNLYASSTAWNVGAGTTNPKVKLQSSGSSNSVPALGSAGGGLYITNTDENYGLLAGVLGSGRAWIQAQRTDTTATGYDLLLEPSGGNVGIATTSPVAKLAVNGNIVSTVAPSAGTHVVNLSYLNSALSSVNAVNLIAEDNRQISPSELSTNRMKFGFTAYNNNNNSPYADFIHMRSYGDASGGRDNLLMFNKNSLGMRLYQQDFGSTTPYAAYKDVLLSDNSPTINYVLKYTTDGTTVSAGKSQIIDNGTNVGIGVSPSYKLQVNGNAYFTGQVIVPTPTATSSAVNRAYVDTTFAPIGGGASLWATTSAGTYNVGLGNVGIGTTNPGAKLDVIGAGRFSSTIYNADNSRYLDMTGTLGDSLKVSGNLNTTAGDIYLGGGDLYGGVSGGVAGVWRFSTDYPNYGIFYSDLTNDRLDFSPNGGGTSSPVMSIVGNGNVGIGIGATTPGASLQIGYESTNPTILLESNDTGTAGLEFGEHTGARGSIWYTGDGYMHIGMNNRTREHMRFRYDATQTWMFGDVFPTGGVWNSSGNVGIGTTSPGTYKLYANGTAYFTGTVVVGTPTAGSHAATKDYVDSVINGSVGTSTSAYLLKTGGTMTGNLDMSGKNIIGVNKLSVGTIDPLYSIGGIKYSTFASSIAGGVKEEFIGQGQIKKCNSESCYWYLDFDKVEKGSDEWVWRQVVDFKPEKVEVLMTAQGLPTALSYEFKDNGILFHSERQTGFSYRLIGARFDWRDWPTKALDQTEKASLIIE